VEEKGKHAQTTSKTQKKTRFSTKRAKKSEKRPGRKSSATQQMISLAEQVPQTKNTKELLRFYSLLNDFLRRRIPSCTKECQ